MTKPFLLKYATNQVDNEPEISLEYDYSLNLNVVRKENQKIPLAKLCKTNEGNFQMRSKTMVSQEQDDVDTRLTYLFTKTEQNIERDDEA